ncbi:MAG: phosphomannomutase/phosphoglucomutase [Oscillospiraceae bacterium]|nr:phosphomannomutase/phosphoglucomutase [Oscillospiraceae bacterium]
MDYSTLQNGSDIRGVALAGIPGEDVTLTEDAVRHIARGFFRWLSDRRAPGAALRLAVGRDSRLSGETIAGWLASELAAAGAAVTDMGLCTTPAMFMTTVTPGFLFDGAVMITASHLPWNRNGLKFFTASGGAESADIKRILALGTEPLGERPGGSVERGAFLDVYAAQLRDKIVSAAGREAPLAGYRIVVDAGNGAGGFFAEKVLAPLGADVSGSLYLEPDGRFPNHVPNPELPEAMESIRAAVLASHADLGVIFDTDVDRAGAVLADGGELNRNRLIALMSAIVLREHPGTAVVTDSITSTGLAAFIARRGGVHRRFKRGYRNVINEALRLNAEGQDCQLAMETSGHGAMKENWFLDDGAYLITKMLIELACGRRLETLLEGLPEPAESREFRMRVTAPDFRSAGETVLAALDRYAAARPGWAIEPENYEGVRVSLDAKHGDGWFLLRLSLHDPILPLNIESDRAGGVRAIARELAPFLAGCEGIDAAPLLEYAVDGSAGKDR